MPPDANDGGVRLGRKLVHGRRVQPVAAVEEAQTVLARLPGTPPGQPGPPRRALASESMPGIMVRPQEENAALVLAACGVLRLEEKAEGDAAVYHWRPYRERLPTGAATRSATSSASWIPTRHEPDSCMPSRQRRNSSVNASSCPRPSRARPCASRSSPRLRRARGRSTTPRCVRRQAGTTPSVMASPVSARACRHQPAGRRPGPTLACWHLGASSAWSSTTPWRRWSRR